MKKFSRYILIFLLSLIYIIPSITNAETITTAGLPSVPDLKVNYTINGPFINFGAANTAVNGDNKDVTYGITLNLKANPSTTYGYNNTKGTTTKPLLISNSAAMNTNYKNDNTLASGQFKVTKGNYILTVNIVNRITTTKDGLTKSEKIDKSFKFQEIKITDLTVTGSTVTTNTTNTSSPCKIESAYWDPSGEHKGAWFVEGLTHADIVVKSKDCVGRTGIKLTIHESDGLTRLTDDGWDKSGIYDEPIKVPSDNFKIRILLGEEDCEKPSIGFNCDLYFKINQGNNTTYSSANNSNNTGWLWYDCFGLCLDNGKLVKIIPEGDEAVSIDAENQQSFVNKMTYELLAPIGKLKEIRTDNIGDYFNIMFQLGIGLAGALAVIMIIIAGIQYIGDESIFGKTEAKSKIKAALLGLFIALGAFALLNTIDPALTGKDGLSVEGVQGVIDEEVELEQPDAIYSQGGGAPTGKGANLCTTGYKDVTTYGTPNKINVCNSIGGIPIASNLQRMLDDAKKNGIILSGSGSRSYQTQVILRKRNRCTPDIYNSPSSSCKPPTARPGHSNHEGGGAVDFTCNGQKMMASGGKNSKCFIWLKSNASKYGFQNLDKEPWHWSFNGK